MKEQGDSGFQEFFLAEYPVIYSLMRMMLGDRESAEDASQEAFTALYVHWKKVSPYNKPGAWVRRVALQEAGRQARRRRRLVPMDALPTEATDEANTDLRPSLMGLPLGQRAAIVLHYLEDRPISEIAEIMRCSESTVKVHLHRARRRLADSLGKEEPDAAR